MQSYPPNSENLCQLWPATPNHMNCCRCRQAKPDWRGIWLGPTPTNPESQTRNLVRLPLRPLLSESQSPTGRFTAIPSPTVHTLRTADAHESVRWRPATNLRIGVSLAQPASQYCRCPGSQDKQGSQCKCCPARPSVRSQGLRFFLASFMENDSYYGK